MGRNGGLFQAPGHIFGVSQVSNWSWDSSDILITQAGNSHRWHLKVRGTAMLPACQKFQWEKNWLPKHQNCFWIYDVLLASLRDFGKTYRCPLSPVLRAQPSWWMIHLFLLSPGEQILEGQIYSDPRKRKRGREKGGTRGWHIYPKKPSPCAGLIPLHALYTNHPSSSSSSSNRHVQLTSSTSFLFHAYWWWAGPYSWDNVFKALLLLILNWWVSMGIHSAFTQTRGWGGWSRGYGECRWLVSWPVMH